MVKFNQITKNDAYNRRNPAKIRSEKGNNKKKRTHNRENGVYK